jgi:hypothetical protein
MADDTALTLRVAELQTDNERLRRAPPAGRACH